MGGVKDEELFNFAAINQFTDMKTRFLVLFAFVMNVCGLGTAQTYRGMADVSFAIGSFVEEGEVSPDPLIYTSISTTHGVQVNRNHFLGLGIEYSPWSRLTYDGEDGGLKKAVPVYVMWRMDFFNRKCSPFFDVRPGYQVGGPGGFYAGINGGLRIAMGRRSGFNVSLGFELRRIITFIDEYNNASEQNANAFTGILRFGFDF